MVMSMMEGSHRRQRNRSGEGRRPEWEKKGEISTHGGRNTKSKVEEDLVRNSLRKQETRRKRFDIVECRRRWRRWSQCQSCEARELWWVSAKRRGHRGRVGGANVTDREAKTAENGEEGLAPTSEKKLGVAVLHSSSVKAARARGAAQQRMRNARLIGFYSLGCRVWHGH